MHDLALYGSLIAVMVLFVGIVLQFESELYR